MVAASRYPQEVCHGCRQSDHTFKNATEAAARLLFVHQPAALEEFFEEFGIPVERPGETPDDLEPPDFAAMAAALERNGVEVVCAPSDVARGGASRA
jgi:hypothetical protein